MVAVQTWVSHGLVIFVVEKFTIIIQNNYLLSNFKKHERNCHLRQRLITNQYKLLKWTIILSLPSTLFKPPAKICHSLIWHSGSPHPLSRKWPLIKSYPRLHSCSTLMNAMDAKETINLQNLQYVLQPPLQSLETFVIQCVVGCWARWVYVQSRVAFM